MKYHEGDAFLVTSPYLREKAVIIGVEKTRELGNVYVLDNQVKFNDNLKPINSRVNIEPWNEEKYAYLLAKVQVSQILDNLAHAWKDWDEAKIMAFHSKLIRIKAKFLDNNE